MRGYKLECITSDEDFSVLNFGDWGVSIPLKKDKSTNYIDEGLIKKLREGDYVLLEGTFGDNPQSLTDGGRLLTAHLRSREDLDKFILLYSSL